MKFCDRSLPTAERVVDLLANLTLPEKAGLLGAGPRGYLADLCVGKVGRRTAKVEKELD